jgi:dTDP-glucose pyrophosphorylase
MNIVMPVAGLGSRFAKVGIHTPKPLINICGKPMVMWAAASLPFAKAEDFIFVVRKEHVDSHEIDVKLRQLFSGSRTIVIDYVTEGAACTALKAEKFIKNDDPLIITDCDHYFLNRNYNALVTNTPEGVSGAIPVFPAEGEKWSFTKTDDSWTALQVAEKVRISPYANIGSYFFSRGRDFVWGAEKMISENKHVNNEFYVCPVYQELIDRGDTIKAALSQAVWGLGTPEDVEKFTSDFESKRVPV